jgi:hypothetical protein
MKSYMNYCCTCCLCLFILFIFTYLGKKQMFSKFEPFVISTHDTSDVLLDTPTKFEFKHTSLDFLFTYMSKKNIYIHV